MIDMDLYSATEANPWSFFDTAAGPDFADIYGPPQTVLDTFLDGTPVSMSEQYLQNQTPGVGSGGSGGIYGLLARADVRSLITLAIGLTILHLHMKA